MEYTFGVQEGEHENDRGAIEAIETMEVIETLTYIERRRHSTIPGDRVIFHGQRLAKDAQINRDIVGILFFLLLL